jgi:hypothetical protein
LKIITDPLFAGRLVSVLVGLGSSIGVFVLSYLLFEDRRVSLIATLIYAISPFSLFFDRLALADSTLAFFGIWTLVFSVITVKKVRLDSAMLAGFFLGGSLLTKSPGAFFAMLIPTTLILYKWPKKLKDKFLRLSVFVFLFSFTYAIAFGMYNVLRLGPNFHMIGTRNKDYVYPLVHFLSSPLDPLKPFLSRVVEYLWLMGPSVLVVLVAIGLVFGLSRKRRQTIVLAAWGIFPIIAVSEFSRTMTARYIYFAVPYLFVISALPFLSFSPAINKKRKGAKLFSPTSWNFLLVRRLCLLGLFVLILHSLIVDVKLLVNPEAASLPRSERSGYLEEWTAGTGIKEVSEHIRDQSLEYSDQAIVVGTEGYFGTLPDGLQVYLNDLPKITVIGTGLDFKEVPTQLIESKQAGNKTYFVVNSTRLLADPSVLGLKLLSEYPKAARPDGSGESLYFFEVTQEVLVKK